MIQLSLERGASLHGWVGRHLAEMAHHLGYHSMAEILGENGFEIIELLP
jgi:hypothetical protein